MRFITTIDCPSDLILKLSILFMRFECSNPEYTVQFVDFQFSLWDSNAATLSIQFSSLTFNSLYEIHYLHMAQTKSSSWIFQFSLWDSFTKQWLAVYTLNTFNSLYEIRTAVAGTIKRSQFFQFSLWDSSNTNTLLLIIIKTFNSLYEIRQ